MVETRWVICQNFSTLGCGLTWFNVFILNLIWSGKVPQSHFLNSYCFYHPSLDNPKNLHPKCGFLQMFIPKDRRVLGSTPTVLLPLLAPVFHHTLPVSPHQSVTRCRIGVASIFENWHGHLCFRTPTPEPPSCRMWSLGSLSLSLGLCSIVP